MTQGNSNHRDATQSHGGATTGPDPARDHALRQSPAGRGDETCRIRVHEDVVYGQAAVRHGPEGTVAMRDLLMDIHEPSQAAPAGGRPALVLAFGGAFHRGSRKDDAFGEPPHRNHSMAWYCREFARRGYLACSIDYRLVPEDPVPGDTPVVAASGHIPRSRVDQVRQIMGLPAATDEQLRRGVEAASDDMALAVRYLRTHAAQWGIDPARLAVGGFSAGARTALNVALGEREPVAAVLALSGYMHESDLRRHLQAGPPFPAILLVSAEHDLDYVAAGAPAMARQLQERGLQCESVRVPQATHFYPAQAEAIHATRGPMTVLDAMAGFLERVLAR